MPGSGCRGVDGFGNPETFFAVGQPSAKAPSSARHRAEKHASITEGRHDKPKRPGACPVEGDHVLPQEVDGLWIVTRTR